MKKIILLLVLLTSLSLAQSNPGGLANLMLGFSARNTAMGDLGVATAKGASAFYYNPALLNEKSVEIIISHNSYIQDVNTEFLGIAFDYFGLPFALGFSTTTIPNIEIRTKAGEAQGKFDAHYFYAGLSTAFDIYKNLRTGMTVKYLYEGLFSDKATGYALDLGLNYDDLFIKNFNVGFTVKNFGKMDVLRNESTKLPSEFRFGAGYNFNLEKINSEVTLTTGVQKYIDGDNINIHTGAEVVYQNSVALRMGYITGYESKNISVGLGIRWNSFQFDYSFVPYTFDLGTSNFISISYLMR